MIPRPTVAQLLLQCRRELMQNVVPQIDDETTLVALEQVQMILDACAHRSENEIADMVAESQEMELLAREAVEAHPESMPRTSAALSRSAEQHNESLLAEVGDWVQADQVIATAGNSGNIDPAGVYFEIRQAADPTNPVPWFK